MKNSCIKGCPEPVRYRLPSVQLLQAEKCFPGERCLPAWTEVLAVLRAGSEHQESCGTYVIVFLTSRSPTPPVDSADPGVHRGHHRLPPGCFFRLLCQTPGPGPEGAGAPEGVRHPPDGHVRHRLPHQLRGDHGPQLSVRARRHLDHRLR